MRVTLVLLALAATVLNSQAQTDYFALGKKAVADKNYALAVDNFKNATVQKPTDGEAWYELGWSYNELEKYTEAVAALKSAKVYLGDASKVYFESGYALDLLNKKEEAIADYTKCIELNQEYSGAYRQLGNIYYEVNKDYKKALELYTQYINYSLESNIAAKIWFRKGYCEIEMEQYEESLTSLKKAIDLNDKYTSAYDELGYAFYKLERADDAKQAYEVSRELDSTSSTPYSGLGDVYRYLKSMPGEAFGYYQKGVALNPKSPASTFGMGWCYNERGDFASAIPYLKKSIESNNRYASAFTELGYAYYGLKRYDEALVQLNKSLAIASTSNAFYYSGLCYVGKKQKGKAEEMQKKLVELNSPDAVKLLEQIKKL